MIRGAGLRILTLLLLAIPLGACQRAPAEPSALAGPVTFTSRSSFGFCLGYCTTELTVDSLEATYVSSSRDSIGHPPVSTRRALLPGDWEALLSAVDAVALMGLDSVYGCPDCADGGAEIIGVTWGPTRVDVAFEHGRPPPPLAALHEQIWRIRERFPLQP